MPVTIVRDLIAPPLCARTGVALVEANQIRFFAYADTRSHNGSGLARTWQPRDKNETIRAAALSPSADIYIATASDAGRISIRDALGNVLSQFDSPLSEPGRGVGLVAQGRAGDVTIYVWSQGQIAWQRIVGSQVAEARVLAMADLRTPPLTWQARLLDPDFRSVAWNGGREAAVGVYPMPLGDQRFGALDVGSQQPALIRYCEGRPRLVASGARQSTLIVDELGVTAVEPRTGTRLAERRDGLRTAINLVGLSSGNFLSLEQHASETLLTGWNLRGDELVRAFDATLQAPDAAPGRSGIRCHALLSPIEIDDGVAIALTEGAGATSKLRLWCEREAFQSRPA
jgi:hypothetical protein